MRKKIIFTFAAIFILLLAVSLQAKDKRPIAVNTKITGKSKYDLLENINKKVLSFFNGYDTSIYRPNEDSILKIGDSDYYIFIVSSVEEDERGHTYYYDAYVSFWKIDRNSASLSGSFMLSQVSYIELVSKGNFVTIEDSYEDGTGSVYTKYYTFKLDSGVFYFNSFSQQNDIYDVETKEYTTEVYHIYKYDKNEGQRIKMNDIEKSLFDELYAQTEG